MADNNLDLVVELHVNKANASIKSVNTGLFRNALSILAPMEKA